MNLFDLSYLLVGLLTSARCYFRFGFKPSELRNYDNLLFLFLVVFFWPFVVIVLCRGGDRE